MKTLTLWQPWASLIAIGAKRYETRSWDTSYRGPLAIHASKHWDRHLDDVMAIREVREAFTAAGLDVTGGLMPLGVVLCVVDLVNVVRAESIYRSLSHEECMFGDYSSGRYAWELRNLRVLREPIRAVGHQGLWEWRLDLEDLAFKERSPTV